MSLVTVSRLFPFVSQHTDLALVLPVTDVLYVTRVQKERVSTEEVRVGREPERVTVLRVE